MTKPQHLALDLYGAHLHLATDRRALATIRRKLPALTLAPDDMAGTCLAGGRTPHLVIYIDVAAHDSPALLVDTIAHEATHAAALLLDHIGQAYDGQSECLAYLVGYVASWCYEGCRSLA